MLFSSLLLTASLVLPALSTYTWPNFVVDELEHLLVDTGGPDDGGIKAAITPCTNYVMGTQILGRMTAAQCTSTILRSLASYKSDLHYKIRDTRCIP